MQPSPVTEWRTTYESCPVQESETAITIHRLSDQLDAGNIIHQEKVKVRPRESGGSLAVRLERQAARVMVGYLLTLSKNWKKNQVCAL